MILCHSLRTIYYRCHFKWEAIEANTLQIWKNALHENRLPIAYIPVALWTKFKRCVTSRHMFHLYAELHIVSARIKCTTLYFQAHFREVKTHFSITIFEILTCYHRWKIIDLQHLCLYITLNKKVKFFFNFAYKSLNTKFIARDWSQH